MKRHGFTLAEMLIVVLMVSIMLVIMAPVMTKKAKEPPATVKVIHEDSDSVPVGSIVMWYGPNIPLNWIECSGQSLDDPSFSELKEALGGIDYLPNLNLFTDETVDTNLKWIIRVRKK